MLDHLENGVNYEKGLQYVKSDGEFCIRSNDGRFDVALHVHVQVYSNGRVTWTPPALYCSSCGVKVDIEIISIHQIVKYICKKTKKHHHPLDFIYR